jgi:hypothetical protein
METMPSRLPRRKLLGAPLVLAAPLLFAACATDPAPPTVAPLQADFTFLNRLRLDVAEVLIEDRLPPPPANDRGTRTVPTMPDLLHAVARDRLLAEGTSGRAVALLQAAEIIETRVQTRGALFTAEIDRRLDGRMKLRVDLIDAEGQPAGFTEAEVRRSQTVLDNVDAAGLARMTQAMAKQLVDALNVELEFQARRTLGQALVTGPRATTQPVQQEDLTTTPAPGRTPPAPAPGAAAPGTPPTMGTLQVPRR